MKFLQSNYIIILFSLVMSGLYGQESNFDMKIEHIKSKYRIHISTELQLDFVLNIPEFHLSQELKIKDRLDLISPLDSIALSILILDDTKLSGLAQVDFPIIKGNISANKEFPNHVSYLIDEISLMKMNANFGVISSYTPKTSVFSQFEKHKFAYFQKEDYNPVLILFNFQQQQPIVDRFSDIFHFVE